MPAANTGEMATVRATNVTSEHGCSPGHLPSRNSTRAGPIYLPLVSAADSEPRSHVAAETAESGITEAEVCPA